MDDWSPIPEARQSDSPTTERFDPSWKHIFAWGYDPKTGRFDAWPIKGDHRREHKKNLTELWGREPKSREGDVMGVASYIPAERKIDGSVVAPPHMLFQPYYNQPLPLAAQEWAENNFPDVVAQNAKLSKDGEPTDFDPMLDDEDDPEGTLRWIWNRQDGILIQPTSDFILHDDMTNNSWGRPSNAKDYRGYALPEGDDKIEIECFDPSIPPIAYEQVKAELSKMFPDKEIVLPHEIHADAGVTFGNDPAILSRRHAAAEIIRIQVEGASQMPAGGSESLSDGTLDEVDVPARTSKESVLFRGLRKVMGLPPVWAASGADKEGAMIALYVPEEVGKKIKQRGGEPVEDMHITLAYFADKAADRDDWDELRVKVEQLANQNPPLKGKIGGVGVFQNPDGDILWASPSVPGLDAFRQKVVEVCEEMGFSLNTEHGWVPHITLKYDFKGKLPKLPEKLEVSFDALAFSVAGETGEFDFKGHFEKETAFEDFEQFNPDAWWGEHPTSGDRMEFGPQTWSGWKGAYRFVTDGEHFLKEPEEDLREQGFGWHGGGHPEMEARFRSMYHDSKKPLVAGWAVPTADEMGYGILAPSMGLLGPDEPGMHELIRTLDQEFEKPCHFVNSWKDIVDPKRYAVYPEGGQMVGLSE